MQGGMTGASPRLSDTLRRPAIGWPRLGACLDLDLERTEQLREHHPVPDCNDHLHEHGGFLERLRAFRPYRIGNLSLLACVVCRREYRALRWTKEIRFPPVANRNDFFG